jgi:4-hydroxybenzoate polyprenyltransferase
VIGAYIEALRPRQWTKNLLLFAGLLFSQQFDQPALVLRAALGFLAFSLLAGSVYVINDIADVEHDRVHPRKRTRPVASGRLPVAAAWAFVVPTLAAAVGLAWWLGSGFAATAAVYAVLNLAYSAFLKRRVLLDVFVVALGFVLRAIAGVEVLRPLSPGTILSPWLLLCTFFGALFLGLAKRRREIENSGDAAVAQRAVLEQYSTTVLDGLLLVAASASLMSYALYTIWPATVEKFGTEALLFTTPFVAYGIFRYLHLVHVSELTEDPSHVLLTDRPLGLCVLLYLATVVGILYLR